MEFIPNHRPVFKNCLLAVFVLLAGVCSAQNKIELSGSVIDSSGSVLPMANVQLIAGKDTFIHNTSPDGFFSFQIASSPKVQLITSHIGFNTDYKYLDASSNLEIKIILIPAGILLSETVVKAQTKALVSNSELGTININSQKLRQIPSAMGVPDMIKVLQLMPGVQNSGEANGYLYVRGGEPGHNLILYNNVPVYGMSHLMGIFPFCNTDHVDSIHFDKSGSEAQLSNRLGATVQAVSPNTTPTRFSVKGNVGIAASQITLGSPLGKKAGLILSGRQTYVNQIIMPIVNSTFNHGKGMDDLNYSFRDANLTLMLLPAKNHQINVNAFASGDHFSIIEKRMMLNGVMKWDNYVTSANWDWQLKKDVRLSQEVYFSRYTNNLQLQQASTSLRVHSEVLDRGIHSRISFKLGSTSFISGIQYASYHVRPQELLSNQLTNTVENDNTVNARHLQAYLQGKLQLSKCLSLNLGIRAGYYTNDGDNHKTDFQAEPRVGLSYKDGHHLVAYLSYARKSQYLHLITTSSVGFPTDFWIATSKGIPAELADNFSIGSSYRIIPSLELTAGMFYSRLLNQVQYPFSIVQFNEITSFENDLFIGKGKAYGAEFMLKKTGRLSGWISYTWSKSDRYFNEIDNGQSFPSKFDRRHNLSLVTSYEISSRWSTGITQVYTSGNRYTTPTSWYFINNNPVKEYGRFNNVQMPNYVRTDLSVDFYLKKKVQRESVLNLSVYNLFAVDNPIYVILDVSSSNTEDKVTVNPRYKSLYTILPSIGWRFKF